MGKDHKARARFTAELEPVLDGLYRTALRLTRDRSRAEDVLQDAILKAYRFFGSFKDGTNFRAWIHRVLYTVFVNSLRDHKLETAAWTPSRSPRPPTGL